MREIYRKFADNSHEHRTVGCARLDCTPRPETSIPVLKTMPDADKKQMLSKNFGIALKTSSIVPDAILDHESSSSGSRRCERVVLKWPLVLARITRDTPLETRTENLSAAGFYCFSIKQFRVGERLVATVRFPEMFKTHLQVGLCLKCAVQVVRVDPPNSQTGFGVGCRIDDYEFAMESLSRCGDKQNG